MASKYITAIDPFLRKRVLFVVENGWATSLITGYSFIYEPSKKKHNKKHDNKKVD